METTSQMIEFSCDGERVPGFLAHPVAAGKYPGVIVIQEWWGLVAHIKDVAERLAGEGFVTLAPDLYHGQAAGEPDEARKLAMALDRERAVKECSAAGAHLAFFENVLPKKVGVVGWCMGGGLSLSTAAHNGVIGAAVCFYGRPLERDDALRLRVPVLGLYGEEDKGIPLGLIQDFERHLIETKVTHQIVVYPSAPHAFFNDTRPEAYRAEAAEDAWRRTIDWFRQHLI
ncbi:MAG: dienelactone hydrolase family protein [Anaerolineae bacterium]|nr:MAG: dienelactone hydrolase family protein [Anaerolineae bacterium]